MKKDNLTRKLHQTLGYKQELIPKTGKGNYNVTVPMPYKFDEREKEKSKSKTIRERKVEEMIADTKRKLEQELAKQFRANNIPKSTLENRYERICEDNERRREEIKRLSIALTKQNEKPFSFTTREKKAPKPRSYYEKEPEPFRANKIPFKVLVPLYKRMVDKIEHERELRIKKNAELSYQLSRLPPRMEEHAKAKKEEERAKSLATVESEANRFGTFKPLPAKPIPDF